MPGVWGNEIRLAMKTLIIWILRPIVALLLLAVSMVFLVSRPYWFIATCVVLIPIIGYMAWRNGAKKCLPGHCQNCSYNLTGTTP